MYNVIGKETIETVLQEELEVVPFWYLNEVVEEKLEDVFKEAYDELPEQQVPLGANVVSSYIIIKMKFDESGNSRPYAR